MLQNTLSEHLTEIAHAILENSLPPAVKEKAKMCFLDFLAAAYAGANSKTFQIGISVLKNMGHGESTLIGTPLKGSVLGAAFFNGMIAHAEEVDDAHRYASGLHLGATIFPASLALSEMRQLGGEPYLRSVVAGYEIASRICRAVDAGHRERGYHSTGTIGPFGAGVASAGCIGLDREKMTHALGIAGSTSAGLFAFLEEGATVKHMHTGRASMDGLLCALLAENGLTGPKRILEAKEGFFNAYARHADIDEITRPLNDIYEISFAYHKIHSACGHSFPSIDAALAVQAEIGEHVDRIESIRVRTYRVAAVLTRKNPQTIPEARFSIPFIIGLALVKGRVSRSELVPEILKDPRILRIAECVDVIEDKAMTERFPKLRTAELTITMKDGRVISRSVDVPRGMPDNPVFAMHIEAKFRSLSAGVLSPTQQDRIIEKVRSMDTAESMTTISRLLSI